MVAEPCTYLCVLSTQTVLHACDISNPGREWSIYNRWTDRITEEFLTQGRPMQLKYRRLAYERVIVHRR